MGISYFSMTTVGPPQAEVLDYFERLNRGAIISETERDITTIFDEEFKSGGVAGRLETYRSHSGASFAWHPLAMQLSKECRCAVFAAEVYDGHAFYYAVYQSGHLADEYLAFNFPFTEDHFASLGGGDASVLCTMFGVPGAVEKVDAILHDREYGARTSHGFADRHLVLVESLGLPPFAGYMGFYAAEGDIQWKAREGIRQMFTRTSL